MKILCEIFKETIEETLSILSVDGIFVCYILEDQYRDKKVYGDTRIPRGQYRITLKKYGGFFNKFVYKFPQWVKKYFHKSTQQFKGSLKLNNVPGFEEILIHCGNTDKDTNGCLLTGSGYIESKGRITVLESVKAYVKLYDLIEEEVEESVVFITLK